MLVVHSVVQRVRAACEVCAVVRVANVGNSGLGNKVVDWLIRHNHWVIINLVGLWLVRKQNVTGRRYPVTSRTVNDWSRFTIKTTIKKHTAGIKLYQKLKIPLVQRCSKLYNGSHKSWKVMLLLLRSRRGKHMLTACITAYVNSSIRHPWYSMIQLSLVFVKQYIYSNAINPKGIIFTGVYHYT